MALPCTVTLLVVLKSMLCLSVTDPSLFLDLTWSWTVMDGLHGSDHFPVLVKFNEVKKAPIIGQWDFRNVHWDLYSNLCTSAVTEEAVFSRGKIRLFNSPTSNCPQIIPKIQCKPRLPKVPWFTDKCKLDIKKKRKRKRNATSCFSATNIRKHF